MTELIEIEHARELILERATARRTGAVPVALAEADGRFLADPVEAAERVPGFDNSAMDGYAVRAADLDGAGPGNPRVLNLVGESRAGRPSGRELGSGEAIAISTGAMVPVGCDAVVRVEDTRSDGSEVEVLVAADAGANIRRAGEDIEPGRRLLGAGARLGAAELGVLASVGVAEPRCARPPRVSILGTGDELVAPSDPLTAGAVRNSNGVVIEALCRQAGAEPLEPAVAPDDPRRTTALVREGLEADALVVCGGISVGEHDHVRSAFSELGVEEVFWRVSLKPGKPAYFGESPSTLVFGLPGNPVSAFVTFVLFVRPALVAMQGGNPEASRIEAELTEPYEKPADRAHAIRCRLTRGDRGWLAEPALQQGSHVMTSLLGADGLALVPAATTAVGRGEPVEVELLVPGA